MAMSPQGTTVLSVTAMDQDTGVDDEILYSITSECWAPVRMAQAGDDTVG